MDHPKETDRILRAFPADVIGEYLPEQDKIPKEFWEGNEWTTIAGKWFAGMIDENSEFHAKEGIDAEVAFWHCKTVLGSYQPKHQHKIAGVGFLLSKFFTKVEL